MSWTDERVELLKKLWSDGLSASQIAGELGGITRNAVIGKVHRLGLSGRAKSASSAAPSWNRTSRPAAGRSAIPAAAISFSAAATRSPACPIVLTIRALPISRPAIAAGIGARRARRNHFRLNRFAPRPLGAA